MITAALTERLDILELREKENPYGDPNPDKIDVKSVYASITTRKGNTTFDQGELYNDNISFYLRYDTSIKAKVNAIRYNDAIYSITNCTHNRQSMSTIIDCVAVS